MTFDRVNGKCQFKVIGFVHQAMAFLFLFGMVLEFRKSPLVLIGYCREFILSFDLWLFLPVKIISGVACVATLFRKEWGAKVLKTTLLYMFAAKALPVILTVVRELFERIYWGQSIIIGGGPDFLKNLGLFSIALFFGVFLYIIFIATSHALAVQQSLARTSVLVTGKRDEYQAQRVLFGLALVLFGFLYKSLDLYLFEASGAVIIASFLIVIGTAIILFWHVSIGPDFFGTSGIIISTGLVVAFRPGYSWYWLMLPWSVPFVIGVIGLIRKGSNRKLSMISVVLTVFLVVLFVAEPFRLYRSFGPYPKASPIRPKDFPAYIQVPEGASRVGYMGGETPSVSFFVVDPHPATETLRFIENNLKAGWRKLDYNLMSPNIPSSHIKGWSGIRKNENPERRFRYCMWIGEWINDKRETLYVMLEYRFAEEGPEDFNTLYCNIHKSSPKGLQLKFIEHYERVHGSFNEDRDRLPRPN